jgi:hypothetical protein
LKRDTHWSMDGAVMRRFAYPSLGPKALQIEGCAPVASDTSAQSNPSPDDVDQSCESLSLKLASAQAMQLAAQSRQPTQRTKTGPPDVKPGQCAPLGQ